MPRRRSHRFSSRFFEEDPVLSTLVDMHPLDKAALATAPVPILGDVLGVAADARMYAQEPEERNWLNYGLSAAGVLPFIPSRSSTKAALDMSQEARLQRARDMGFDTDRVWYHGTENDVSAFKPQFQGRATGAPSAKQGYFFTDSPKVASDYSELGEGRDITKLRQTAESWERIARRSGKSSDWDKYQESYEAYEDAALNWFDETGGIVTGSNVVPAYLSPGNQKIVDFGGDAYREESYYDILRQAKEEGYDSVRLTSTIDPANPVLDDTVQDITVVFDPANVRSVNAAFDPAQKGSSNLLASLTGAGLLGAGSLLLEEEDPFEDGYPARLY